MADKALLRVGLDDFIGEEALGVLCVATATHCDFTASAAAASSGRAGAEDADPARDCEMKLTTVVRSPAPGVLLGLQ
jgi:hypothetical protein